MIIFFLFGLSISFFLFLLTLIKRNKTKSDHTLAAWMGFMTIHLAFFVGEYSQFLFGYPHLLGLTLAMPLLHAFFLYTYTRQTTRGHSLKWTSTLLLLSPLLLLAALPIPFYALSGEEKVQVYLNEGRGFEWYGMIQISLFVVCGLASSIFSIIEIRRHRKQMLNAFSNNDHKKLVWLEGMAIGLGCIWTVAAFVPDSVIFSMVVLLVLFIGIFGINQTPVFLTFQENSSEVKFRNETPVDQTSADTTSEKYSNSGLSDDEAEKLISSLEFFMDEKKPYRNPDLTLDELAGLINVSPNQLSQVINSQTGKTYYHYVNQYRVKEFLSMASSPDSRKLTYLGLAQDCGFQSKTTFNKYFKLVTGKTPSEYFQTATAA